MRIGYFPQKHTKNNVSFFLEEHAQKQPHKIAFYFLHSGVPVDKNVQHDSITYRDFNDKVSIFGGSLLRLGIKKGDRVIIFVSISPELYISIAGLQRIGAIPVLIDSLARKEQLGEILQNSQPKGIIAPLEFLKAFGTNLDFFRIQTRISTNTYSEEESTISFSKLLNGEAQKIVPVEQNDTALITYTTGSSGTPKGANRTHRFLAAQHYALKRLFPYGPNDIDLPVFPVFTLNNIASGISTVIPAIDISKPNPKDPQTLVLQITNCGVNSMTLAPSSFRNLATYCNAKNILLNKISRVLTGGAPISETDILKFMKIAPSSKNWILYGSTEVEPISYIESQEMISINIPRWTNITKIGVNVGKIDKELNHKFINIEAGNLDENVKVKKIEVKEGEVGELIVAGENVCQEYYKNEDAFSRTKIKDEDGTVWHRTGDLARIDKSGFLWIVGRKHNVIKQGTEYFFPVRPEIILKDLPHIINAAYLNIEHNDKNSIIVVVTLERKDEAIEKLCRKKITKVFKKENLPLDEIVFMEEIPMDVRHHSKVDYSKLRQKLYEVFA